MAGPQRPRRWYVLPKSAPSAHAGAALRCPLGLLATTFAVACVNAWPGDRSATVKGGGGHAEGNADTLAAAGADRRRLRGEGRAPP